jgi:hypothetical protein
MCFCVLCIVGFVMFLVLFLCICVLNNCHRVATQLQLNISYQKVQIRPGQNKGDHLHQSSALILENILLSGME